MTNAPRVGVADSLPAVRILLIVNATASSVTARTRVVIQKALAADHELRVAETSRRGHASRLARGAAVEGVDVVAVLAGDGTLNEAADGLAGTTTALATLPGGSTNVFARTLGLSMNPVEATAQLLDALARRSWRRVGLGSVSGRHFLFHAGLGFDAAVIAQVERRGWLKRYAAHPVFVAAALTTWARHYDRHDPALRLELDGETIDGCYFVIISNTSPYTYLGQRPIVVEPEVTLDTPLGVTAFRTLSASVLLPGVVSALTTGRFLRRHRRIVHRQQVHRMRVIGRRPFPYQVDGDHLGDAERLAVAYEADSLTLVVP